MKTIKEPKKNIALLWKPPRIREAVYRPMKYLLRAQVEDGLLLYNVVTSEMVLLEDAPRNLAAARALGLGTVGVYDESMAPFRAELLAAADLALPDFSDLAPLRAFLEKGPASR